MSRSTLLFEVARSSRRPITNICRVPEGGRDGWMGERVYDELRRLEGSPSGIKESRSLAVGQDHRRTFQCALRAFARTCLEQYVTSCAYKGLPNDRKVHSAKRLWLYSKRREERGTTGEYAIALTYAVMSFAAMIKRLYNFQNQL